MPSKLRTILAAITIAGAAVTTGCAQKAASERPPETPSVAPDDAAASILQLYRFHHQGGVTLFVALSLDTLGVPPERRASIQKIRDELHEEMAPARAAERELITTLADELAHSKFDAAKLDAALGKVTTAVTETRDASVKALNELHGALSPPERAALADKVEAHWGAWRRANHERARSDGQDVDHVDELAAELGLSTDQEAAVRAALEGDLDSAPHPDRREVAARLRSFGEAFRGETFDAGSLAVGGATDAALAGWGAVHLVHLVEVLSPVLTPPQREELARQLHEHATHEPAAGSAS